LRLGSVIVSKIEWGPSGDVIEDRFELDLFIQLREFADALLQAFGDRQIKWPNDIAPVRLGGLFAAHEKIVDLLVDEGAVALEVLLIDVEPGRRPKESLELCHAHHMAGEPLAWFERCDHDA